MSDFGEVSSPRAPLSVRLAGAAAYAVRSALETIFPPTCLSCRAAVSAPGALCGACWGAMRFIERPFCDRLGTPFEHEMGEGVLSQRAVDFPPVSSAPGRSPVSRTARPVGSCIG